MPLTIIAMYQKSVFYSTAFKPYFFLSATPVETLKQQWMFTERQVYKQEN